MNETSFIKANIKRWEQFESWLKQSGQIDPDRLAGLYLQLTDDLSYARTHYQNGEITHYLNNLATKVHSRIYRNKKEKKNRFVSFWKYEVPSVSYRYRKNLLYSFIIFGLAMVIGAVSAEQDASFVRLILGDSYVNMTEANIEKDDPMAVYKSMGRMDMFLAITFNNVRVSLMAFAAGILLSFGTGLMLFYNGIMLGSFQYFFYQKGLLLTSVLSIWIHGTLEISAIIIAGAAGLILGNSILFPGTYTRSESLRRGARDGLKLVMGLVPIFVVAGFLESFITRLTGAPPLVKALIIVISAFFILYYFLIYPAQLAKMENLFDQRIKLYQQREFSQKISATFTFVRQCTKSYFKAQLAIAGPVTLLLVILMATFFNTFMDFAFNMSANPNQDPGYLFSVSYFLNLAAISLLSLLMISTILLVNFSFLRLYHQKDRQAPEVREVYSLVLNRLPRALLVLFLWFLLIMAGFLVFILPGIYLAVVATLSIPVLVIEDTGVSKAFSRPFRLIKEKWWSTFGLIIVMGILGYFIALAFSIPGYIAFFADSFLGLSDGQPMAEAGQSPFSSWTMGIYMLFAYIGQLVSSCLMQIAIGFQYFNLVEMKESRGLLGEIDQVGQSDENSANEGEY